MKGITFSSQSSNHYQFHASEFNPIPNNLTTKQFNQNPFQSIPKSPKKRTQFTKLVIQNSSKSNTQVTKVAPIVVVGSANADIYVEIERMPKEGETISAINGQTLTGGKGANQALCASKLSYPTFFFGQVGEDAHGKLLTEALKGGGVCLDHLKNVSGAPTGHAVVMLQSDGQNSIIIVGGANMYCWPREISDKDLEVVRNAGIVLLQREIPDFVNLQVAKNVKQVLVKLGDKGSALFIDGEEPIKQSIIPAPKVLDTTGAGDTFTAAFAVALVEGKSKKDCLKFAAAAASLCVRVKGAIPSMPDRDSVMNLLQSS